MTDGAGTYCKFCAHRLDWSIPAGDTLPRHHCPECGHVEYETPIATVSTLLIAQEKILFVRRAIPPYTGKWAPPGGYPEKGESMREAAVRELKEETGLVIPQSSLIPFFLSSISPINQYYIAFRSHVSELLEPTIGAETSAAAWFGRKDFPAEEYWLPALASILDDVYDCVESNRYPLHVADVTERRFESSSFEFGGSGED